MTENQNSRVVNTVGWAGLVVLVLVAIPVSSLAADSSPQPEASTAAAKAEAERPLSLAEILTATEALGASERRIRQRLADGNRVRALASEIDQAEKAFSSARRIVGDIPVDLVGFFELVDLAAAIRASDRRLTAATEELVAKAKALDADLDRLADSGKEAGLWIQTARARNAPPPVLERIEALPRRIETLAQELRVHRDQTLEVLSRATQLHGAVNVLRAEVSDRREQLVARLRTARAEPIWRLEPRDEETSRMTRFIRRELAQGVRHVRDNAALLLAIAFGAFALSYWLIVASRERLEAEAESDPYARRTVNLFRVPAVAPLMVSLLALVRFGPVGPFTYDQMLWSLVPIPAALLARATIGPQVTLSLYTLAGAMISIALLGALVDPLPITSRLVLIAQCVAVAVSLSVDLRRGHLGQALSGHSRILVRWVAAGMVALLALAVVASVTGYLGASRILRNGVLGALGLAVVLTVSVHLLYGLTLALMQTRAARSLRIVRLQPNSVHRSLRTGLVAVAWLAWVAGMLMLLGLVNQAAQLAGGLADAEIKIGSTSIALVGIWVGLVVVLGTYVLVRVVRLVLEVEILPRLNLKQGVPFAVSTVTRYVLVTAGVLLAMAAMGIDLTKVTLLAGALGVGIGFGLQGVVNNFVSGLILLVERPINVGDAVQMGDLRGVVKRIGVRSSTVRTPQGAEVIVPNAELISREVTNWTLSDRKRQLEIDVGVAYGTEPDLVVRLLETAAKEVEEVETIPAPRAWFMGFGDSSLNFRLQAWIDEYDRGLAIESELRMAVMRKFKEANIEIPFPQREIRLVRDGPDGPAAASPPSGKDKEDK